MGYKSRPMAAPQRTIALLRGINVGGHNRLPMSELRELIESLGAEEVATYIQSGNLVFTGSISESSISAAIERRFGFQISVMTRLATEIRSVVASNPFGEDLDPKKLHVGFLSERPVAEFANVGAADYQPDRFEAIGREVYLYTPNGMSQTRFNAKFYRSLGRACTLRNWRTVKKLVEIS